LFYLIRQVKQEEEVIELFAKLLVEYVCRAPQAELKPKNKNNLIRSAFGACLRRHDKITYECFFEGRLTEGLAGRGARLAFFSPECSDTKKVFEYGERLSFQMSVVCPYLFWKEAAVPALPWLFSQHGFGLSEIRAMPDLALADKPEQWSLVMNSQHQRAEAVPEFEIQEILRHYRIERPVESLEIQLASPLRLERSGRLISEPGFADIVFACYRRLKNIYDILFMGREKLLEELAELPQSSLAVRSQTEAKWQDWYRKPNGRAGEEDVKPMVMGGTIGRIRAFFDAPPWLNPFVPLLKAGGFLHIGKGITMGNGLVKLALF
jgi:hypothetical protein